MLFPTTLNSKYNALGAADRAGVIAAENWNNAGAANNAAVAGSGNKRGSLSALVNDKGLATKAEPDVEQFRGLVFSRG